MRLAEYVRIIANNIWFGLVSCFLHRDPHIVLFGSWMGTRFADNSRFLFQYLSENKEALHLKRVIWVTRKPEINDMLRKMNYESYLCGTKESKYWHLKSGVHILCNSTNHFGHDTDIDIQYSFGAKKIQLWHGAGMKAVGASANRHVSNQFMKRLKSNYFINKIMSEGGWGEAYFLTTSELQLEICLASFRCSKKVMFVSNYPRNCECLELLDEEKRVIDRIKQYKGTILYLPTFRDKGSRYTHPLNEKGIKLFLKKNNYLWIEKQHSFSTIQQSDNNDANVMHLNSAFDINVLYPFVNAIVSDYSTVTFDGVYRHIPVIMYTPDLDDYNKGSNGLLSGFETYYAPVMTKNPLIVLEMLEDALKNIYFDKKERVDFYKKVFEDFWNNSKSPYETIWNDIKKKAHISI